MITVLALHSMRVVEFKKSNQMMNSILITLMIDAVLFTLLLA